MCAEPLERQDTLYRCPNGHSYDRSAAGYVHLLPVSKKHSKDPGDDKGMAAARNRFLSGDYYRPLRDELIALTKKYAKKDPAILDAGCGEGYYSAAVVKALQGEHKEVRFAGVDLSKHSLRWAAKREKGAEFAVASVYDLPIGDRSIDLLLNCFSPLALEEFLRVLKPEGVYLYVVPGKMHLWELKEVLYENPYPNEEKEVPYEGLKLLEVRSVEGRIHLQDAQTIHDLFQMTPYYWKTPKEGAERLAALSSLEITISFRIHVFRKEEESTD